MDVANISKHLQQSREPLIGLHTVAQAVFWGAKLNPMLAVSPDALGTDEGALLNILHRIVP